MKKEIPSRASCKSCKKWKTSKCKIKTTLPYNRLECWDGVVRRKYDSANRDKKQQVRTPYRLAIATGAVRPKSQSAQK